MTLPGLDDPDPVDVAIGWVQVAVDPNGVAWVSWVEFAEGTAQALRVARSERSGEALSAPWDVPVAEPPVVGGTEKPALAASVGRLAVAYTARGALRHADATRAWVQLAELDAGTPTFGAARLIDDQASEGRVVEQIRVGFGPGEELWGFWKRQVYGVTDFPTWARESEDFVGVDVSADLDHRHDCSPPDFRFARDGRPLVALRGNLDGWLQTLVVASDEVRQVSVGENWSYSADVCPLDGPRVIDLADGTLFAAWIGPAETVWALYHSSSTDGGATWSAPVLDHANPGLGERWVALASEADHLYLTVENVDHTTRLLVREGPDGPSDDRPLQTPDGLDLASVELAAGGGRVVAAGLDAAGAVRLVELE